MVGLVIRHSKSVAVAVVVKLWWWWCWWLLLSLLFTNVNKSNQRDICCPIMAVGDCVWSITSCWIHWFRSNNGCLVVTVGVLAVVQLVNNCSLSFLWFWF